MRRTILPYLSTTIMAGLIACPTAHARENTGAAAETAEPARTAILVDGHQADGQNTPAANGALGTKALLDTPYSITVVDSDDIAKRQATSIGQIFVNDPSVFSFSSAGTTNWWGPQIRGLGVRNYYIDDVPLLLYWGGDFPLESVESVTALKGLTGFMYGFGSPGGVIAYRTKRPTAEPLLTTEIGYRTVSDVYGHVDAGGPLTRDGRLGYRLNIAGETGTAYNRAGVNRWLGSLALEYALGADLHWYATATYEDSNLKHEPLQFYWNDYRDTRLPRATYDYDNINIDNSFYKTNTLTTATGFDWQFAKGWSARLTYGYTSKKHRSNKMFAYMVNRAGDYKGFAYNFAELDSNHFAQAMLQGDLRTGPVRHEITAGASFQINNADFGTNDYYWSNDFNGNIYRNQTFRVTRALRFGTDGSPTRERQRALFFSDTLHLGDHVQALFGVRYTRYTLHDSDPDPAIDSGYRASAVSPTIALIYKPVPHVSIYGSYVEAMEPGSRINDGKYANIGEVLKATVSKQYEIGAKYDHGGLSLTAAGFRIERANTIDQLIDGKLYLKQDGMTLYKGVEAILSYRVNPDFRFGLGAVHLDPSIRKTSPDNAALVGNIPGEASKWQVVGNAEYRVAGIEGLSLHGNVRYFGKSPTDDINRLYIPSRTLANIGFQYVTAIGDQKLVFTGNVNNLFNRKYWGQTNIGEGINGSLSARIYW